MNVILTKRCNKGCSYCFAHGKNNSSSDASFEEIRKVIDTIWDQTNQIKLIGGEPTIAKCFKETLDYVIFKNNTESVKKKILIISNFLFSEDILNFIKSYLEISPNSISFLANATELDEYDRKNIFLKNYEVLTALGTKITLSFTIDYCKSISYLLQYVKFLKETFPKVQHYRLSMKFPNGDSTLKISKLRIGYKIYRTCKALVQNNIAGHFDCVLLPCLFYSQHFSFIKKFFDTRTVCHTGALDIQADGTVIKCYPASYISSNVFNTQELVSKSINQKEKELIIPERQIYFEKKCTKCKFNELKLCFGPCSGFFSL